MLCYLSTSSENTVNNGLPANFINNHGKHVCELPSFRSLTAIITACGFV